MRTLTQPICWFVLVTASAAAHADELTAKEHVDEGTKLYNVQKYDKAAEQFQAAYLLDPEPDYLYASAQAQRLAGDCTNAVQSYRAYLRTEPPADKRDKAEKNIERCTLEQQSVQAKITIPRREIDGQSGDREVPTTLPGSEQPSAPQRPTKSYLVGHILVGAGVAAIAGGVYLYREGHSAIESHNSAQTYDEFAASHAGIDAARRQQVLGVTALAAGGGLVLGGVLYYVLRARTPAETTVSAQVKSDGTMVFLGRSF
ncbi:MAG: hypothetical protein HOV81_00645 [Kofleriaceae bacterium]|nr:hypothetical protein [Kofleriaceae bacterium]